MTIEHNFFPVRDPLEPPDAAMAIEPPVPPPLASGTGGGWWWLCGVSVASLAFVVAFAYLESEPMVDAFTGIGMMYFFAGLVAAWIYLLHRAISAWRRPRVPGFWTATFSLLPVPYAVAAVVLLAVTGLPEEVRFSHSERGLEQLAREYEASGQDEMFGVRRVGWYKVHYVFGAAGCVFMETSAGIDEHGGFAYCTGELPRGSNADMEHLRGDWWTYYHFNGFTCMVEPCNFRDRY
jgi:hypothetical protein